MKEKDGNRLAQLLDNLPQTGRVEWIGVRPARGEAMQVLDKVMIDKQGLQGDRYQGKSGKRSVTLIQFEHLAVIASVLHREKVTPEMLRRNIVVSGINLLALKGKRFRLGEAVLEMTGLCHPCSRMERVLGEGGYNAMRGHGGINASVIKPGNVCLHDRVSVLR